LSFVGVWARVDGVGGCRRDRRAAGRRNVGAAVLVVCRCLGEGGRRLELESRGMGDERCLQMIAGAGVNLELTRAL